MHPQLQAARLLQSARNLVKPCLSIGNQVVGHLVLVRRRSLWQAAGVCLHISWQCSWSQQRQQKNTTSVVLWCRCLIAYAATAEASKSNSSNSPCSFASCSYFWMSRTCKEMSRWARPFPLPLSEPAASYGRLILPRMASQYEGQTPHPTFHALSYLSLSTMRPSLWTGPPALEPSVCKCPQADHGCTASAT